MKLISCYVEGYGKIKQEEFFFDEKLSVFSRENGAGKTTLASFVKAMFYGLEPYRTNSKEFFDRQHFYPFDGGEFGGNITFEMDGKRYKIERFFGEKSDTLDTVKVYENGVLTNALGDDIGKAVFGIDKQSFERTAFISADEIEISSTSGINAKLNQFVQGMDEETDYDEAQRILEKAAKEYKKAKAGKDKISETSEKLNMLKEKIANAETVKAALKEKYVEFEKRELEIKALEEKVTFAQTQNELLLNYERYEEFLENARTFEKRIAAIESGYPFGVPTLEEIAEISRLTVEKGNLEAQAKKSEFSAVDEMKLTQLSQVFKGGVPSEQTLMRVEKDIEDISKCEAQLQLSKERIFTERERLLMQKFSARTPSETQLAEAEQAAIIYREKQAEYAETPMYFATAKKVEQKSEKGKTFILLLSATLLLTGIALAAFVHLVAGLICAGVGVIGLAVALLIGKKETAQSFEQTPNPERFRIERELRLAEDKMKALLLPYGYASGDGVLFDLATLKKDLEEYYALQESERIRLSGVEALSVQQRELFSSLTAFFKGYGVDGENFIASNSLLASKIDEFENLQDRKNSALLQREELLKEIEKSGAGIRLFEQKYHLLLVQDGDLKRIESDAGEYVRAQDERVKSLKKAAMFKEEKNLTEKPNVERVDIEETNAVLNELRSRNSTLRSEIIGDEYTVETLDGYLSEKELAEETLLEYKHKHKLLTCASAYLQKAEQNLKEKYVKPIKDEFLYYSDLLEKTLGEKVTMSKNFEISFERHGKERSERHLSAGQRSICALCFRLALIKNMYADKKPFLILDDPFVALDETHMQKVQKVLLEVAKDMQIIYFVCHSSRSIEK